MKVRIRWLVGGVIVAALLLIGFAGTALADPKGTPGGPGQGGYDEMHEEMDEMHEWCWGPNGHMGSGVGLGLGYWQLETLAGLLDTSVDDLAAQRKEGKSFADIAKAKGVELQTLIDTLTAEMKEHLQLRVDGSITQDQADAFLKARQDALKSILESTDTTSTVGGYGRNGMMGGGMMGGGMMGGFGGMMGGGFGLRTR